MNETDFFELQLTPDAVRTLYYAVDQAIKYWPGSPARPPKEQEDLRDLKLTLFAITMELLLTDERGEDDSPS